MVTQPTQHEAGRPPVPNSSPKTAVWLSRIVRLLLVLVLLAGGAGLGLYWLLNRPQPEKKPQENHATLVQVMTVSQQTETITVRAMGTVVPARTVQLAAQVSGRVIEISPHLVPGGRFEAGQRILKIEPLDYELAIRQREAELTKAASDLKIEMGQQSVALREYELLENEVRPEDRELLFRKPQLAMARAAVASATAALDKAKLDLSRTEVSVPFNAVVQSRNVELGSQVSAGASLAALVGTDEYWIEVSVPMDQLHWISIPGLGSAEGSPADVYCEAAWGAGQSRKGVVRRLMTDLEPEGRMARLIVTVTDPLDLSSEASSRRPLILGSYVRVAIHGRQVDDVVGIPRTALRDGRRVWVMTPDKALDIRDAEVIWGDAETVYLGSGLAEGDQLVTSDLGAPVQGMTLRTKAAAAEPAEASKTETSEGGS
ncbi:MAG: efflux RND transporter periplasmic adaptor subunit [Planctomycetes bacterium]|nr:efflux RND transporter periplasmic adaptor subunit [Planctomycetota bacterium]